MHLCKRFQETGFCHLYSVNSENSNVTSVLDGTLNPINTIFEVLDDCPRSLLNRSEEVMKKIDKKLYKRLEEFGTSKNYNSSVESQKQTVSIGKRDYKAKWQVRKRSKVDNSSTDAAVDTGQQAYTFTKKKTKSKNK